MPSGRSKTYWNDAARHNAAWHVATGHESESPEFFASGTSEVDEFLAFGKIELGATDVLLEIGSGVGRMTRRLAEITGSVTASDVSGEMLSKAQTNLADLDNIQYLEVDGDGTLALPDGSVNVVFSYITMQHVPTAAAQRRYFSESLRLLAPKGRVLIQFRRSGILPRLLDWAGHLGHLVQGRRTLHKAWRGARINERTLRAFASEHVTVDILPFNRRHIWVVARKS
ncbi:SAM-dependent methyltransferase [Cryobacterium mesophilum]|uniref:Class I SAM-dependent methyltransferase n=1 Tax=Terrimesophilobacter mesophilus TaxID=433647 RepID=A0A4R8VAT8_9MICO|nr:class I SAM-dependent methyltransferase [Terrimesophilobacter mesophilus]MBB5632645.1 SAM-dependent methyltransferase [Terrimesophilobacter mesophilus]TFB79456.1 class I SAM-dependent methyltransferase [Terrimesophilobacter mesophilus]